MVYDMALESKVSPPPIKRPRDDCKAQRHIYQACYLIECPPPWVEKDGPPVAQGGRLIGGGGFVGFLLFFSFHLTQ